MILLQGAMDCEIKYFLSVLENKCTKVINGYIFYSGIIGNTEAVISKTGVGSVNSALATIIGIDGFKPSVVINQGTAGAHLKEMKVKDIVIGSSCINLNLLRTPAKGYGQGSDSLAWEFLSEGGQELFADKRILALFKNSEWSFGNKYIGRLGSGDIFSREADRIEKLRRANGTLCEDMESFSVYKVCDITNVPCVSVRIISHDVTEDATETLQKFVVDTACI